MLLYFVAGLILPFIGLYLCNRKWNTVTRKKCADELKNIKEWAPKLTPLPQLTPETLGDYHPIPWRPYKPTPYHITMGLASLDPSEFIQIDSGYAERLAQRKKLICTYPAVVLGFQPEMVPSLEELYEYLFGYYLPRRFPGLFKIITRMGLETRQPEYLLKNLVTGDCHPLIPPTRHLREPKLTDAVNYLLQAIGTTIEEDFLMLLPDNLLSEKKGGPEYKMRAFCTCFPSGFNSPGILGKTLVSVHEPVPGYKERLQMSMDRFFSRIVVGRPWRRWNWTVTMHEELFTPNGNDIYETEVSKLLENEDPEKAKLRVEYQTLTRFPRTEALVFTVRTYLTSIKDIRDDPPPSHAGTGDRPEPGYGTPSGRGGGVDLANAIEGVTGKMMEYKNFHRFNKKVVQYLRTSKR